MGFVSFKLIDILFHWFSMHYKKLNLLLTFQVLIVQDHANRECEPPSPCPSSFFKKFSVTSFFLRMLNSSRGFYFFSDRTHQFVRKDDPMHVILQDEKMFANCEIYFYKTQFLFRVNNLLVVSSTHLRNPDETKSINTGSAVKIDSRKVLSIHIMSLNSSDTKSVTRVFIFFLANGGRIMEIDKYLQSTEKPVKINGTSDGILVHKRASSGGIFSYKDLVYIVVYKTNFKISLYQTNSSNIKELFKPITLACAEVIGDIQSVLLSPFDHFHVKSLYICQNNKICKYRFKGILDSFADKKLSINGEIIHSLSTRALHVRLILIESRNNLEWNTLLVKYEDENNSLSDFIDDRLQRLVKEKLTSVKLLHNFSINTCQLTIFNEIYKKQISLIQCSQLHSGQCIAYGLAFGCKLCRLNSKCVAKSTRCNQLDALTYKTTFFPKRIFSKHSYLIFSINEPINSPVNISIRTSFDGLMCKNSESNLFEAYPQKKLNCSIKLEARSKVNMKFETKIAIHDVTVGLQLSCKNFTIAVKDQEKELLIVDPVIVRKEPEYMILGLSGYVRIFLTDRTGKESDYIDFDGGGAYNTKRINDSCFEVQLSPNFGGWFYLQVHKHPFTNVTLDVVERPDIIKEEFVTFKERSLLVEIKGTNFASFYKPQLDIELHRRPLKVDAKNPFTVTHECFNISNTSMMCSTPDIFGYIVPQHYKIHVLSHGVFYLSNYSLFINIVKTPVIVSIDYKTAENNLVLFAKNLVMTYPKQVLLRNDVLFSQTKCVTRSISMVDGTKLSCLLEEKITPSLGWEVILIIDTWNISRKDLLFDGRPPVTEQTLLKIMQLIVLAVIFSGCLLFLILVGLKVKVFSKKDKQFKTQSISIELTGSKKTATLSTLNSTSVTLSNTSSKAFANDIKKKILFDRYKLKLKAKKKLPVSLGTKQFVFKNKKAKKSKPANKTPKTS